MAARYTQAGWMEQKGVLRRFALAARALAQHRTGMSRAIRNLVILLVVLVGGLYLLSTLAHEQPQKRIEKSVPNEALGR